MHSAMTFKGLHDLFFLKAPNVYAPALVCRGKVPAIGRIVCGTEIVSRLVTPIS
jgi:hypothetical protein